MNFEPSLRLFGPAETSGYGNGPRPHVGYFFSYERLFWSLSKPNLARVGSTTAMEPTVGDFILGAHINGQTVDTGFIGATGAWGNRWEVGYIDTDNYGWQASVLDHVSQGQFRAVKNPLFLLDDPNALLHARGFFPIGIIPIDLGEVPPAFSDLTMKNVLVLNGLELMRFYRAPRLHNGGFFELLYGARWLQINDTFLVQGTGNGNIVNSFTITEDFGPPIGSQTTTVNWPQNLLDSSIWSIRAMNNIVGPQIGGRWERQRERWITSFEARFLAGANFQNVHLKTNLGDQAVANQTAAATTTPIIFNGIGTNTHQFATTFSPVGEFRLQTVFQVTSNVGLKLGYTGLVVGNITRASDRIDYSGPNLISILNGANHQIFYSNGVNFGVEINR
ncbi:MAG: BBP7 family outer membrane beta-barrel protein [Planctomycetia bacterium]|nr:BBP7 family outer membrane beta-barrel protein [Planctomycetia bacterium]